MDVISLTPTDRVSFSFFIRVFVGTEILWYQTQWICQTLNSKWRKKRQIYAASNWYFRRFQRFLRGSRSIRIFKCTDEQHRIATAATDSNRYQWNGNELIFLSKILRIRLHGDATMRLDLQQRLKNNKNSSIIRKSGWKTMRSIYSGA